MNKRIAVFILAASALPILARAADSSSINGWISDSACGAKHAGSGAACVRQCIHGGEKPVFVDESQKAVWTIDNPEAVNEYYGAHVTVHATTDVEKKSVHIDSIAAAK